MAVNLNKQNGNKVNLSKEDRTGGGGKVKLSKTPSTESGEFSNQSSDNGASGNYYGNYSQMGTTTSNKKFKPWFLIPIIAVLLVVLVVALSHRNSDSNDSYEVADGPAGSAANSIETETTTGVIKEDGDTANQENTGSETVNQEITSQNENDEAETGSKVDEIIDDSETTATGYRDDVALHSYEVITADVTWEEAFSDCISRGGYLCRINSKEENDKIKELLNEKNVRGVVYLGGLRDEDSGEYHWIDSERKPFDDVINSEENKRYWFDGEPSFSDTVNDEKIQERYMAVIYPESIENWVWNDVSNDVLSLAPNYYTGRLSYICEYE